MTNNCPTCPTIAQSLPLLPHSYKWDFRIFPVVSVVYRQFQFYIIGNFGQTTIRIARFLHARCTQCTLFARYSNS